LFLIDDADAASSLLARLSGDGLEGEVSLLLRKDSSVEARALRYPLTAPGSALLNDLSYPESAARAVEALLGDVVVCENLDEALAAHASDKLSLRFACLDGSVVWPSGKISAGYALADSEDGVLARFRQLEELRLASAAAEDACRAALGSSEQAEAELREAQANSLELSQQLAAMRGKHEAMRAESQRAQEKLSSVRRELEGVQRQRSEAEQLIASARPDVERYERDQKEYEQALVQAKASHDEAQASLVPLRRESHKINDQLSEAKLKSATLTERHVYTERIVQTRKHDLEQLDIQDAQLRESLAIKRVSADRIEPLLAVFEELSGSARKWARQLEEMASAAENSSSSLHNAVNEARAKAREAHASFDAVNEQLATVRVDKGRLEIKVEAAIKTIVEDCDTPLESAIKLPEAHDREAMEDALAKLRRRIANLGTINPDAAHEYDELKTRYDYLSSQLADLDSARKALAKINRVIDARMKDDFVRTFEQVNENFQEIFSVLFPGGSASLSLVDPSDIENTGVEVTAQPAGKRITKMMLMSGGEKSLTALALLFAVYRTRTTPFYILDEVEAALDDTNLRRLCAYVDQLRDATQLIMITHQRRTMEMADVLFGVSMQADGVTKVVSQRLEKALKYAEG